jgi:hypothetical protein
MKMTIHAMFVLVPEAALIAAVRAIQRRAHAAHVKERANALTVREAAEYTSTIHIEKLF